MFKTFLSSLIVIILLACAGCCIWQYFVSPPSPPPQSVNRASFEDGRDMLTSLANAAIMYSIKHGGNGETSFPTSDDDVFPYIPEKYRKALVSSGKPAEHIGGYCWQIQTPKTQDNFCFMLFVVNGYEGDELYIQKDMVVRTKNTRINVEETDRNEPTESVSSIPGNPKESENIELPVPDAAVHDTAVPDTAVPLTQKIKKRSENGVETVGENLKNAGRSIADYGGKVTDKLNGFFVDITTSKPATEPVIQDVDEDEAKRIFESLSNGATLYSIKHGGNGTEHFPLKVEQFEKLVPSVYYSAMVKNNDLSSCKPVGGYIIRYFPDENAQHFKFKVSPAQYFRGKSFEMTENMEILPLQ